MKKKLDTRFPAARIKKIMQTDEDIGKIAMAVPLLVSKALELFLQKLCHRTYDITVERGAKTVTSLHLKQCVHSFGEFDFLKDSLSKVPDLGGSITACPQADTSATKRRVSSEDEDCDDAESKKIRMHDTDQTTNSCTDRGGVSGRGRGRPKGSRGRGRGRVSRAPDSEMINPAQKFEDPMNISCQNDENLKEDADNHEGIADAAHPSPVGVKYENKPLRNFDLNVDLNEDGDYLPSLADAGAHPDSSAPDLIKHEDTPGWSLDEMEKMAFGPVQVANLNARMDEYDDEDYDEE